MVMQDKVEIDSIDLTSYRLKWQVTETWGDYIDGATITFQTDVKDTLPLEVAMIVNISRGFTTSTDNCIFIGQITQVIPGNGTITVVCKNRMIDTIKSAQTKSWDKDIDTEGGVGSEIFKDICDNSGISYTPAKGTLTDGSIINTGSTAISKIIKFIQNDEDDFQKMNELAERYNYSITYDYDNDRVNFKPKGYVTYPTDLNVGTEIINQIKWKENMEQLINKVKIQGATVYDKIPETFAGPATEFTLNKTPEDTEVRINAATTNDIQTRGQKDVGTLGTDFDYYVDVEQKKLIFSSAVSDLTINYGAQVPLPIILKNQTSIDLYGGPNKKPHFKKFAFTDIKDPKDAEDRGRAILNKYSTPFNEATGVAISNDIIETYGYLEPGNIIRVIDTTKDKDLTLFVNNVVKSWPHVNDKIDIGDAIWRTEDWQSRQMEKINQLFNELNKNQDILIQVLDQDRAVIYERRYAKRFITNIAGDTGIYGHTRFGIYGTSKYGSVASGGFILGHSVFGLLGTSTLGSGATDPVTLSVIQGNNIYREYFYDDDFEDTTGTANWDTTNKQLSFTASEIAKSESIFYNWATVTNAKLDATFSLGSSSDVTLYLSADGGDTGNWEAATIGTKHTFANTGTDLKYKLVADAGLIGSVVISDITLTPNT